VGGVGIAVLRLTVATAVSSCDCLARLTSLVIAIRQRSPQHLQARRVCAELRLGQQIVADTAHWSAARVLPHLQRGTLAVQPTVVLSNVSGVATTWTSASEFRAA
jgi:hypothetical protein